MANEKKILGKIKNAKDICNLAVGEVIDMQDYGVMLYCCKTIRHHIFLNRCDEENRIRELYVNRKADKSSDRISVVYVQDINPQYIEKDELLRRHSM